MAQNRSQGHSVTTCDICGHQYDRMFLLAPYLGQQRATQMCPDCLADEPSAESLARRWVG